MGFDRRVHFSDLRRNRELASFNERTNPIGALELAVCAAKHFRENNPGTSFPLIVFYGTGRLWIEPRTTKLARSAVRGPLGEMSRFKGNLDCLGRSASPESQRRWTKKMKLIGIQGNQSLWRFDAVILAVAGCLEGAELVCYDFELRNIALDHKYIERLSVRFS